MARLPQPGGDGGNWGGILNDYLLQSHNADGTIKDGSVSEAKLSGAVQSKLNATATSPDWASITNKPTAIAAGSNKTAARQAIDAPVKQTFHVDDFGADPTGAMSSDAAVDAAIAALGANPGIIEFGIGRYLLTSTKTLSRAGQYFKGQAISLTTLDYRGTGPCLYNWDSTVNQNGMEAPGRGGGILGGITIDGHSNTNSGAVGYRIGDLVNPIVENLLVSAFTQPGDIGFLGSNKYSWTEYGRFNVRSDFNTNCFVLEGDMSTHPFPSGVGSKTSWSYNIFNFNFSAEANQNGVVLRNHVSLIGINWNMTFNCNPGATNTATAVTVGTSATDDCHVEGFLAWIGEATNPGAVTHQDMNVGANSSLRGHGSLVFHDYTNVPWRAGSAVPYRVVFSGRVNCPSLGHYSDAEIPFVTIGDPGRFGALGDDANYIDFIEGDNGNWPALNARGPSADIGILINTKGWGQLQYNGSPVAIAANTPPTAWNSPGKQGQTVSDGTNFYVCIADNVWKKIPLQDL